MFIPTSLSILLAVGCIVLGVIGFIPRPSRISLGPNTFWDGEKKPGVCSPWKVPLPEYWLFCNHHSWKPLSKEVPGITFGGCGTVGKNPCKKSVIVLFTSSGGVGVISLNPVPVPPIPGTWLALSSV